MINPNDTIKAIDNINNAVTSSKAAVIDQLEKLGKKCDVMQEYGVPTGSEDEVINNFIEHRSEIMPNLRGENNG